MNYVNNRIGNDYSKHLRIPLAADQVIRCRSSPIGPSRSLADIAPQRCRETAERWLPGPLLPRCRVIRWRRNGRAVPDRRGTRESASRAR